MDQKPNSILATILLLDGRTLEREFKAADVPYKGTAALISMGYYATDVLSIWLGRTKWIPEGNEFIPMSQVRKVTWTEITPSQLGS